MYKLEGEEKLIFDLLTTMDGNDSLKRALRRSKKGMTEYEGPEPTLAESSERVDNRDAGDGYYLSRERVEEWAKTRLADMLPMQAGNAVSACLTDLDMSDSETDRERGRITPAPTAGRI